MTSVRPERAFGFPLLVLLGACLASPIQAQYTRRVDVPAAGWVRVPLDMAAIRHMAPDGADLHVFGPEGASIPFRLSASLPDSASRPARVERRRDRWLVDTGEGPPHERLVLDLASEGTALDLESSPDGETWQPLAAMVPVRLGGAEGLQRIALAYPSTSDRYLRLRSTAPIAAASVESVAGPLLTLAVQGAPCRLAPSASICTVEIPAGQVLRRLTVDIEGEGTVGYRLHAPAEFRWELLTEGVWREPGRHVLAGGPKPVPGATLRLELHGPGGPRLTSYALDLAVPTVAFRAPGPGRYLLAYGGAGGGKPTAGDPPAGALWLEPGPEQEGEPAALPAEPGGPLDRIRFSNVWDVWAPNAEPGDLIRLELPARVYGAAREDLGDLRLAVAGRQIPFFRWSPAAPAYAGGEPGLALTGADRPGESRVLVSLPSEGMPLTQIHLSSLAAPLRRPVSVIYVDPDRRSPRSGRAVREQGARSTWNCAPEPPLPCRIRLDLPGTAAPRLLTVRLRDGDNPRLSSLGVTVWRRRDVLLFVWPEVEDERVRLLAGARDLEAPGYELAELGPALLGHPWRPAELRIPGTADEAPWWGRWVMPVGVTIVAAWLIWLLRRILSEA